MNSSAARTPIAVLTWRAERLTRELHVPDDQPQVTGQVDWLVIRRDDGRVVISKGQPRYSTPENAKSFSVISQLPLRCCPDLRLVPAAGSTTEPATAQSSPASPSDPSLLPGGAQRVSA